MLSQISKMKFAQSQISKIKRGQSHFSIIISISNLKNDFYHLILGANNSDAYSFDRHFWYWSPFSAISSRVPASNNYCPYPPACPPCDYCVPRSNDVTDVKTCNIKEILTFVDAANSATISVSPPLRNSHNVRQMHLPVCWA